MSGETLEPLEDQWKIFRNPWPALVVGVGAALLAVFLSMMAKELPRPEPDVNLALRVALVIAGALAAAIAVTIRPRDSRVLIAAAVAALLGSVAIAPPQGSFAWDSLALLLRVLAVLAAVAGVLMACPRWVRRLAVSLIILFHFAGIWTAVTSTHPQPWISGQLWNFVFRPYLQFMYLNNAYHFYSPEPGPASLLWFCIEYENDKDGERCFRVVKEPHLDEHGFPVPWRPRVQYTRFLSLSESANQPILFLPPLYVQQKTDQRLAEGERIGIPPHPDLPYDGQYREPNNFSKYWMSAYAKHVAQTYKYERRPELPVKHVKVYRVVHRIIGAPEIAKGLDMYDPLNYMAYYQGDFDKDGNMLPVEQFRFQWGPDGRRHFEPIVDRDGSIALGPDPMLYWMIPIALYPKVEPQAASFRVALPFWQKLGNQNYQVRNFLRIHMGLPEADPEAEGQEVQQP